MEIDGSHQNVAVLKRRKFSPVYRLKVNCDDLLQLVIPKWVSQLWQIISSGSALHMIQPCPAILQINLSAESSQLAGLGALTLFFA